jgi:tRNA A-37 threonylcarbamoyl transferase component Bud32
MLVDSRLSVFRIEKKMSTFKREVHLLNERYLLQEELGRGGMGVVYEAQDMILNRRVAIKILSETHLDEKHRSRLRREAQAAARLNHPNIASIYDAGEFEDVPYIVMELVEGAPLNAFRPLELKRTIEIATQICQALDHAHRNGVIHRDIKPENVLISDRDGKPRLVDFGLAYRDASSLTQEGEILGTLFYMAPEQATGAPIDERTDLYALGVMLYELVTEELPFSDLSPIALINHHVHTPPPSPFLKNPGIPSVLNDLILKLMNKNPADRPASAGEVLETLEYLLASQSHLKPRDNQWATPEIAPGKLDRNAVTPEPGMLDATSMALIHRYPADIQFHQADLALLFRTALRLGLELQPWLNRAASNGEAVTALLQVLKEHPPADQRSQAIAALVQYDLPEATAGLLDTVRRDHHFQTRTQAALACGKRGLVTEVLAILLQDIQETHDPSAAAALAAVLDTFSFPPDLQITPWFPVLTALIQHRWQAGNAAIFRFARRGALGAGLAALVIGLLLPIYSYLVDRAAFQDSLEIFSLPALVLIDGSTMFVLGAIQGFVSCYAAGLATLLEFDRTHTRWQVLFGGLAGLVHGTYLASFTLMDLFGTPPAGPGFTILVYLVYGILVGIGLAACLPTFKPSLSARAMWWRAGVVFIALLPLTYVALDLLYPQVTINLFFFRILFLLSLVLGFRILFSKANREEVNW